MIDDSESGEHILTKILEQSYESESFLFDISNGANVILNSSGEIIIANSLFFQMFDLDYHFFNNKISLTDFFNEGESKSLKSFINKRVSDPYNSPKTSVFTSGFGLGKKITVILTAIRVPGTNSILLSASEAHYTKNDNPEYGKAKNLNSKNKIIQDSSNDETELPDKNDEKKIQQSASNLRNYQLELLNELLTSANSVFILSKMLDNILNILSKSMGFEIGFVYLKNSDGKTADLISALDVPVFFIESQKNPDVRSWPNNLIFYAGQTRFVENLPGVNIGKHDLKILENLGALSYAAIPLISDRIVIGALFVAKAYDSSFSSFEKETLELIGKEISSIILRGMLQEKLEKECTEAKQCFGLILDDINDLNENLMRSVESIADPGKSLNELADNMGNDIRKNKYLINNLKTIREIGEDVNAGLYKISLDEAIEKAVSKFPKARIRYQKLLYNIYSDNNLPEVFVNILDFMLNLGAGNTDIIINTVSSADKIIISIESTGPGLSDEEKMLLFSDFDEENIHLDSSSLGLYTVFILVRHYGGKISVSDRIAGDRQKGLEFKILLNRYYD